MHHECWSLEAGSLFRKEINQAMFGNEGRSPGEVYCWRNGSKM